MTKAERLRRLIRQNTEDSLHYAREAQRLQAELNALLKHNRRRNEGAGTLSRDNLATSSGAPAGSTPAQRPPE